jgi:hypothetical protein
MTAIAFLYSVDSPNNISSKSYSFINFQLYYDCVLQMFPFINADKIYMYGFVTIHNKKIVDISP